MKNTLKLLAAFGAACLLTLTALAADVTPAGTWKWTAQGRGGGPGFEMTLKLDLKDGALTGTMVGMQGPQGAIPDVAIGDASYKDGLVKFSVTREWNGNKRTTKYEGKLEGDTLKGFTERTNREGALQKADWVATRAK